MKHVSTEIYSPLEAFREEEIEQLSHLKSSFPDEIREITFSRAGTVDITATALGHNYVQRLLDEICEKGGWDIV